MADPSDPTAEDLYLGLEGVIERINNGEQQFAELIRMGVEMTLDHYIGKQADLEVITDLSGKYLIDRRRSGLIHVLGEVKTRRWMAMGDIEAQASELDWSHLIVKSMDSDAYRLQLHILDRYMDANRDFAQDLTELLEGEEAGLYAEAILEVSRVMLNREPYTWRFADLDKIVESVFEREGMLQGVLDAMSTQGLVDKVAAHLQILELMKKLELAIRPSKEKDEYIQLEQGGTLDAVMGIFSHILDNDDPKLIEMAFSSVSKYLGTLRLSYRKDSEHFDNKFYTALEGWVGTLMELYPNYAERIHSWLASIPNSPAKKRQLEYERGEGRREKFVKAIQIFGIEDLLKSANQSVEEQLDLMVEMSGAKSEDDFAYLFYRVMKHIEENLDEGATHMHGLTRHGSHVTQGEVLQRMRNSGKLRTMDGAFRDEIAAVKYVWKNIDLILEAAQAFIDSPKYVENIDIPLPPHLQKIGTVYSARGDWEYDTKSVSVVLIKVGGGDNMGNDNVRIQSIYPLHK